MSNEDKQTRLTSAEISNLWSTYINDSLVVCVLSHFLETAEDEEVRPLLQETIKVASSHLRVLEELYQQEGISVPKAFPVDEHVNLNAPRLFSDIFYLEYIHHMSKFGLSSHASAIAISSRNDIRQMFESFIGDGIGLNKKVTDLMKSKGVYIRPPYMNYPKQVDFVEKQNFLTGWFGKRRPLLGMEVCHLYITSLHNEIGKSTLLGFAQVAKDKELKSYFMRGAELCSKILNQTHDVFQDSNVPASMTWDSNVSDSTEAPYSEQLMLFLVSSLSLLGISAYGIALSMSIRHDLGGLYTSFIYRATAYAEDGANLLIERGWMEQPPGFLDRDAIIKGS